MLRLFMVFSMMLLLVDAATAPNFIGSWHATRNSFTQGTSTVEREYLHLNTNHSFSIEVFVSVKKGDAFIKDLRIEGSGIWKNREGVLALYVEKVNVPFAKEIYRISQESLRQLANSFRQKFENEPLRIIFVEEYTADQMITTNEKFIETVYTRQ